MRRGCPCCRLAAAAAEGRNLRASAACINPGPGCGRAAPVCPTPPAREPARFRPPGRLCSHLLDGRRGARAAPSRPTIGPKSSARKTIAVSRTKSLTIFLAPLNVVRKADLRPARALSHVSWNSFASRFKCSMSGTVAAAASLIPLEIIARLADVIDVLGRQPECLAHLERLNSRSGDRL